MSELDQQVAEIANEYRRLERQLQAKTQQLQSLLAVNGEAGEFPTDFDGAQPRRYSIEYHFVAGDLQPQERSVNIENGTIFRCAYMESFVRAIGTAADVYSDADVSVQVTLPWNSRVNMFDYFWRIRDSGTDREWMDNAQPSLFGGGGYVGPLWFPRRNILSGGTVVSASIEPFKSIADFAGQSGTFFNDGAVQQYVVHMSFVGHDVPDNTAL